MKKLILLIAFGFSINLALGQAGDDLDLEEGDVASQGLANQLHDVIKNIMMQHNPDIIDDQVVADIGVALNKSGNLQNFDAIRQALEGLTMAPGVTVDNIIKMFQNLIQAIQLIPIYCGQINSIKVRYTQAGDMVFRQKVYNFYLRLFLRKKCDLEVLKFALGYFDFDIAAGNGFIQGIQNDAGAITIAPAWNESYATTMGDIFNNLYEQFEGGFIKYERFLELLRDQTIAHFSNIENLDMNQLQYVMFQIYGIRKANIQAIIDQIQRQRRVALFQTRQPLGPTVVNYLRLRPRTELANLHQDPVTVFQRQNFPPLPLFGNPNAGCGFP
jgi:hypothetical protein